MHSCTVVCVTGVGVCGATNKQHEAAAKRAEMDAYTQQQRAQNIEAEANEARRTLDALAPFVAKGARIVGLEPSCLLTLRDEFLVLLPKAEYEKYRSAWKLP